jgi:hypothetical protein
MNTIVALIRGRLSNTKAATKTASQSLSILSAEAPKYEKTKA